MKSKYFSSLLLKLFVLATIYLSNELQAQMNLNWLNTFSINSNLQVTKITTDKNNDIIISGWFSSTIDFDPGPGSNFLVPNGQDAFIAKYSSGGNFIWANKIGGAGSGVTCNYSTVDTLNNIYITGKCYGNGSSVDFDPGPSQTIINFPMNAGPTYAFYIVKLNSGGNFQWVRDTIFGSLEGSAIQVDNNNDIVVGCSGNPALIKYNANGGMSFFKNFGGLGIIKNVKVDNGNNIFISGSATTGPSLDLDPGVGSQIVSGPDIFIAKYNSVGTFVWGNGCGVSLGSVADMELDLSNNIYLTGTEGSPGRVHISKWNGSGNPSWLYSFGNITDIGRRSSGLKLKLNCSNSIKLIGYFTDNCQNNDFDFDPGPSIYTISCPQSVTFATINSQLFYADINTNSGSVTSVRNIGGGINTNGHMPPFMYVIPAIHFDNNGNTYLSGVASGNNQFDFNGNSGTTTLTNQTYIVKYNGCGIVGIDEHSLNYKLISIWPNPSGNFININSPDDHFTCCIFDLNGRQLIKSNLCEIDISNLPNSIYFIQLHSNSTSTVRQFKFIKL